MLQSCFSELEDPRYENSCEHLLIDIIAITILGVMCGADDWTDLETFGNGRREWLEKFLALPNGIPAHDTFRRVFGMLDPKQFSTSLLQWTQGIQDATDGQLIAIDGQASSASVMLMECGRLLSLLDSVQALDILCLQTVWRRNDC